MSLASANPSEIVSTYKRKEPWSLEHETWKQIRDPIVFAAQGRYLCAAARD
jgi:hypothetical protein